MQIWCVNVGSGQLRWCRMFQRLTEKDIKGEWLCTGVQEELGPETWSLDPPTRQAFAGRTGAERKAPGK